MDFVGELQIKTGGYEAEYGGAMGGVISVVTKSGSNSFHGETVYNYWGDKLTGANRDRLRINPIDDMTAEYMEGEPKDPSRKQEIGFSLSGPVLKDRVWFFGMYLPRLELTQRDVTFITDGQTRHYERDEKTHSALIKLSSQVGQKLSLAGSYGLDWNKYLGELPRRDGNDNPEDNWTEKGARRPAYTVSTSADYMISPKFLLSGRGGYFHSDDVQLGGPNEHRWRMVGAISVFDPPESLLRPSGWQNISTGYVRSKSIRDRTNASVDSSVFLNAGGEHNLKVGYQYNRIHNDVDNAYKNDFMYFYWNRSYRSNFSNQDYRGAYGYLRLISGPETPYGEKAEVQSGRHAIFLQDSWRPTRNLSLNAGLRLEKEDIPSFSDMPEYQGTAIEFAFSEKIAPRLGAAYDVFGDSRFKIFGSWGLFYDVLKLELPNGSFGGFKWKDRYYTLETLDWKSIGGGNYTPNGGQFIEEIDWRIPSFETLDPDLKPMRMQEVIFGSEYLLGRDWVLSTRFVHKQLDRAIEDVGVETDHGEMYYITNPGYGYSVTKMIENGFPATPKAKRNYDAFEVGLNKRFTRGWSSRLNYTYSRLRGLYSGLASSDEEGRQSPNVDRDFDGWWLSRDAQMRVLDGPLQTDRPHQFKAIGNYEFGWGLNLGVYQSILSGRPLTRTVDINHMETIVENRGSDGRMPFMTQTDFFVSHGFKLTEKNSLEVSFTVFNLFNQKEVTDTYRIMNRDSLAIDMVPGQPYDYKSALAAAAAEEATFLDPRFLKANGFQDPIQARFGIRFLF